MTPPRPLLNTPHCRITLPEHPVTTDHLVIETPDAEFGTGGLTEDQAADLLRCYSLIRRTLLVVTGCDAFNLTLAHRWRPESGTGIGEPAQQPGGRPQLHVFGRRMDEPITPIRAMLQPPEQRQTPPPADTHRLREVLAEALPEVPWGETDPTDCGCCVPGVARDQELWRAERVRVITPQQPLTATNLLVMPLRHVSSIAAFTAPEMSSLWDRLAETDTRFDGDGLSTFINDGPRASQHIPHVHAHVLGRAAAEPENPFALLARRIGLLPE